MNKKFPVTASIACAAFTLIATAKDPAVISVTKEQAEGAHIVAQKDKAFTTKHLVIEAGEAVVFPNQDPFYHNVFSLSSGATFDLGSYPQGEARKVTFDEPGEILVECAIHPTMQMTIEVK